MFTDETKGQVVLSEARFTRRIDVPLHTDFQTKTFHIMGNGDVLTQTSGELYPRHGDGSQVRYRCPWHFYRLMDRPLHVLQSQMRAHMLDEGWTELGVDGRPVA